MVQNFKKIFWTQHSQIKMKQYGLSKQKLLGILSKPERKEKGIAPGTNAVMKTNPAKFVNAHRGVNKKYLKWQFPSTGWRKAPGEIWLMYKDVKRERKIISAWRYPGISKPGEEIPIPEDIKQEIITGKIF